ncbi:hypothetical protein PS732_01042 [Pseudomonas fluorescens]|uniref:CBM-cenC domain-containing protein n=1 Tax=Pseudomonas fluorescens TaxID=294 RepID=A0ABD7VBB0_PSEFL|nr:hypothetical protein [Pseudomonas fluorescens]VVO65443.1 hypothetical protein PS732_01042 [Pseudomonas fluorescens]
MTHAMELDLPVPVIKEALTNNTLYPMDVLGGATAVVKYEMDAADDIILYCEGPGGLANPTFEKKQGDESGCVEFVIAASTIGNCIGTTLFVWYEVFRGNASWESQRLELQVQYLDLSDLPEPALPDVTFIDGDEWLDLRSFSHDAEVTLAPPPFFAVGQKVWVCAVGQRDYPSETLLWLLEAAVIEECHLIEGIQLTIPRGWLFFLDDYSALTIKCYLAYDGQSDIETAQELPRTTHNIRQGPYQLLNDYTDFGQTGWNRWKKGPAAANPLDLIVKSDATGDYLWNWGYTSPNNGIHLIKEYEYLVPGRRYDFTLELRRNSPANPAPTLSLESNDSIIVEPMRLLSRTWITVGNTFIANSSNVQLRLVSHVNSVGGNDYDVTRIRLKEISSKNED